MVNESQPYRTSYHFQPPKNWLNDPNGPMLYKGLYHLFYQYNPNSALFGDGMVWAHSVSYDLINWVHLNHALHPTEPFDIKRNKPVILYTGIDANNTQVQNLAMPKNLSDPLLKEWIKFSQNPVITPPIGIEGDHFRDPTTAWLGADGKWNVIIGSSINDQGMAILYQSDDFVNWSRYQDPLYSKEKTGMWDTNGVDTSVINPGVKHVMKASFNSHDYYMIGTYVPGMEKYIPDTDFTGSNTDLRYDYGKFYASKTFFDSVKDRRILWGWINESDSAEDDINKGWSGLQSIPRQVWLDRSGSQLVLWPVEEINKLHDKQVSIQHKKLDGGSVLEIPDITASQIDHSIIESFGGEGRTCISSRVYPQLAVHKEAHLYVFNNGTQSINISRLNAWGMSKAQFIYEENCFSYKASQ
ncbi:hypothetical protein P3X46_007422 [Hevea brasiliensis]|uniref:Glycosyl hydrolase family 32 N-terminal domain-containing protein n=1 Tax=Hevea brasiliensis TaxID=3981 RepID=A0ABQ9MW49_HEVBR|nr:hypothetical protein P3X46_007422 [Hevea brasiliensis]